MEEIKKMIQARKDYVEKVRNELLGPGSENIADNPDYEIITDNPRYRYSTGILYPKNVKVDVNQENAENHNDEDSDDIVQIEAKNDIPFDFEEDIENDDDILDEEISLASQNKPSSFGLIFFAKGNTDEITCNIDFATYRKAVPSEIYVPYRTNVKLASDEDGYGKVLPYSVQSYLIYDKENGLILPNTKSLIYEDFNHKIINNMIDRNELEDYGVELENSLRKYCDVLREAFIREPFHTKIKLCFDDKDCSDNNRNVEGTNVCVRAIRREISESLYVITVTMINDVECSRGFEESTLSIYQPEIRILSSENDFVFFDYSRTKNIEYLTEEEQSIEMQYRNKKSFATGLGVAANWSIDKEGNGEIYTDFLPVSEVSGMGFNIPEKYGINNKCMDMHYLSDLDDTDRTEKIRTLSSLVQAYKKWIDELKEKCKIDGELDDINRYKVISQKNISGCEASYSRMVGGLNTLEKDDNAWNSFQLANRAMYMQRYHLGLQDEYKDRNLDDEDFEDYLSNIDYFTETKRYSWRPFQIAFLLMSINSIVYDDSDEKNVVDLIWFPTGGGKTEAYLGLTAFSIFYRRLSYSGHDSGTAVIMRYTLRLLTAQQFTRASTLICACEKIREESVSKRVKSLRYNLGKERITIGLWIGGEHTPNTRADAVKYLKQLMGIKKPEYLKFSLEKNNKFQVLKCPWCGRSLVKQNVGGKLQGDWGYMKHGKEFQFVCPQPGCHFSDPNKLPIQVIDEELYDNPPTLLFGTVDKFAMIPWEAKAGRFFGVQSENRAPELIIQDELHLISGPLGTMVGQYETAIDIICKRKGNSPKIIASTATIRGAKEQCSALYNRETVQFPHPGLDIEDSFFARELTINHDVGMYGRQYVGIMTSGKSKAMSEDKVFSTLLQRVQMMNEPDEIKDKYWTLTAYFNSLKELGKCSTLLADDIYQLIQAMGNRYRVNWRNLKQINELTSRVSTTELNETLDRIENNEYSSKKTDIEYKRLPSDVVLATNMISVGIDVRD